MADTLTLGKGKELTSRGGSDKLNTGAPRRTYNRKFKKKKDMGYTITKNIYIEGK